jgi:outer membrane protein insertion porin family
MFNPTSGSLHGIAVKDAMPAIGSEANFTKLTLQTSWYVPLFSRVVAALSGRAGISWPHGETTETPLHERFYLGGGTTIRGYTQDSVGPTGTDGTPQGGQSMLLGNAELRINPAGGFGVVLFTDAGNVWDEQTIHTGDLRASYGGGIRYNTPVGPLRVDYGQKINRQPGESPGEVHFSLGHVF